MTSVIRSSTGRRLVVAAVAASVIIAGVLSSPQRVGAVPANDIRAAVRGADGAAWAITGSQGATPLGGSVFTSIGGGLIGVPVVVSIPLGGGAVGLGTPYYIAVGLDHNLYVRSDTLSWAALSPSPVYCTSSPTATAVSAHAANGMLLTVGCRGSDGALWYGQEEPAPADATTLPLILTASWKSLGGAIVDGPAVAAVPNALGFAADGLGVPGELTFFANGTDGHVYTRTLAAAAWTQTAWMCVNHLAAAAANPGGASPLAAFACEGAADHFAHVVTNTGTGWSAATVLGGTLGGMLLDGPGLAVGGTTWTVFAEGEDHALWATTSAFGVATFGVWSSAGGSLTSGATGAALLAVADTP